MNKTLILVPMYNEEKRIDLQAFSEVASFADILFIDDGSKDHTFEMVSSYAKDHSSIYVVKSEQNLGKGPVLQFAVVTKLDLIRKYSYIAYWDADLSTPLHEIIPMIQFLKDHTDFDSVWGSRKRLIENHIKRRFYRHLMGRIFNLLTRLLFNHPFHDTQCGAKVFTLRAVELSFNQAFLSRWIFDLEIFIRLKKHNLKIQEMVLQKWIHKRGSKISLFKDGPSIFLDIFKCFLHYSK